MDSFFGAIRYIFLFLPLKVVGRGVEKVGIVYGLFEYYFQNGKRKAQRTYNRLKDG